LAGLSISTATNSDSMIDHEYFTLDGSSKRYNYTHRWNEYAGGGSNLLNPGFYKFVKTKASTDNST